MDRPVADVVPRYFAEYERRFALPVRRPEPVVSIRYGDDGRLLLVSKENTWSARRVINVTGTWTTWRRYGCAPRMAASGWTGPAPRTNPGCTSSVTDRRRARSGRIVRAVAV